MSYRKFFISDTHFGHAGCLGFKRNDGTPLRDFKTVEEMDEHMVERWNSTVRPVDTVYHCGDVAINRRCLPILSRLNGKKILIKGNHDIFKLKDYLPYFNDIRAYRVFPEHGLIASHIPIHPECLSRWRGNVHGHLHSNRVYLAPFVGGNGEMRKNVEDDRYISVCVEQINYTPISLEEIVSRLPEKQVQTEISCPG